MLQTVKFQEIHITSVNAMILNRKVVKFGLKSKSKKELADEYGLHYHTISAYLNAIGIRTRKRLSPKEQMLFYTHYGRP